MGVLGPPAAAGSGRGVSEGAAASGSSPDGAGDEVALDLPFPPVPDAESAPLSVEPQAVTSAQLIARSSRQRHDTTPSVPRFGERM